MLNKKGIFNGLITFIYPFFVYIIKSVELNGYIFFFDLGIGLFFIIAFILSIISIILYCILVKEKSDRKNYIGGMIAAFCSTLLLTLIIPYMTIQTINYTFDNSKGIEYQYKIIDKETGLSSGRHKTKQYYFIIEVNNEKERINIEKYIYHTYDINDKIELIYYEGFLNISYLEYTVDD